MSLKVNPAATKTTGLTNAAQKTGNERRTTYGTGVLEEASTAKTKTVVYSLLSAIGAAKRNYTPL